MQHESAIVCEHVWKIFGDKGRTALEAARGDGLSKDEIFERFECVVGVADVDFTVRHGEIFCVMGLSGSGKSHAHPSHQPADRAERRAHSRLRRGTSTGSRMKSCGACAPRRWGWCFSTWRCFPIERSATTSPSASRFARWTSRSVAGSADEKLALVQLEGWGDRMPAELSGRDAAARGVGARTGFRPRDPADGRAVQRPGPPHSPSAPGGIPRADPARPQDHAVHHPRPRRGDPARRSDRHHEGRTPEPDRNARGDHHQSGPTTT